MLSKLIYASQAINPMPEAARAELVLGARSDNEKNNLSGMLLYSNQSVLQILEGDIDDLNALCGRITADSRHTRHFACCRACR